MIFYLVTKRHAYTMAKWLEYYQELWDGKIVIIPYEDLSGCFDKGSFIFSDIERLKPSVTREVEKQWNVLSKAGCKSLNHPVKSLRRYALQKALSNDFRIFRTNEIPDDVKFPVFLRRENDHTGNVTPLLYNHGEVRRARLNYFFNFENLRTYRRGHFKPLLLLEFIDTASSDGIYRKYSAFKIGSQIIPHHILFSTMWCVKKTDSVSPETIEEEYAFFEGNPHESEVRKVFEIANIDYGRIDYSFYQGRMQVWEINTNPTLISSSFYKHADRQKLQLLIDKEINKALGEFDSLSSDTSQICF